MDASKGMDLIRLTIGTIDRFIYWLISVVYDTIDALANLSIFSGENISEISNRIYVFLGIIMLFKVTFSLITYLINPDTMNDKTQGTGNLIKNIIISLFLVIIVPYAFDFLYNAQSAILEDKLIPRLVLGTSSTEKTSREIQMDENLCGDNVTITNSDGEYISLVTLRPFLQIYDDKIDKINDTERQLYCTGTIKEKLSKKVLYADTWAFNLGEYIFDYSFFISTACGVLVLLLSINFAFDIAVRSIKLGFLEIIAPIPIISYIDPKSGKDGIFKKWCKQVFSTWVSLFLRLAILYLVIYMIPIIDQRMSEINSENPKIVMLFLVIGALMFAKQAIPLIENIFGVKFDKTVQLNPFKKISDQAIGGKQLLAAPGKILATGIGLGASAGGLIYANHKKREDFKTKKNDYLDAKNRLNSMQGDYDRSLKNYNELRNKRLKDASDLKQKAIDYYNAQEEWNPTNAKIYQELDNKAEQMRKTPTKDELVQRENISISANRLKSAEEDVSTKESQLNKAKTENDIFSYNHPIVATVAQSLRGAKIGFDDKETANISKAICAGINAAKKSAKTTNDLNKFGWLDRLKDLGTDITGVKNESGTTSILKEKLKEQNENLINIRNGISSLNQALANARPGAIVFDDKGNRTINNSFNFEQGERENLQQIIDNYEMLRKSEKATSKQIKEYEEVMSINKPPKP